MMHHMLIKAQRGIIEESGVPKAAILEEARGLHPRDAIRPRDIVILHFAAEGRHLIFNGVVTTIYRNSIMMRVAAVPGYEAKLVEDKKFKADANSFRPAAVVASGRDAFVPYAMENVGTVG